MPQDKVFADGLIVKRNDNAPDFVIRNLSVKVDEFKAFLDQHNNNGWVNLQAKQSQGGKLYAELDTWKKDENYQPQPVPNASYDNTQAGAPAPDLSTDGIDDEIPF